VSFLRALQALGCLTVATLTLALPTPAHAEKDRDADRVIEVSLGGSTVVRVRAAGRVTLTDPGIADVSAAGGGLLVIGRKVGETNLILSGSGSARPFTYLIKVTLPARAIQSELARLFANEDIEARAVGGALVLVGTVSSAPIVTQAEAVTLGYLTSPSIAALGVQPNVINLLRVKGRQQVQLEVTFAEVQRSSLREMGVNFVGGSAGGQFGTALGQGAVIDANPRFGSGPNGTPQSIVPGQPAGRFNPNSGNNTPMGAIFFGMRSGVFPFSATLNILAERLLAKTLAQPTLVAMSGEKAEFLAGGELPIAVPSGLQQVTIQFKRFGIQLAFTPTVLADSTIQLNAGVSVSAPDSSLAINLDGFRVPALTTRSSQTTVRLRDGQSFAIAGLLSSEMTNIVRKVPGFGDIPILGALFSSKEYSRKETELVIVVTATLVDPMDADAVPPLPGQDKISDPTDLELFLLNVHEANGTKARLRRGEPMGSLNPRSLNPRSLNPRSAKVGDMKSAPKGVPGLKARVRGSKRGPVGAIGFWR
jgi:pilus assembly protein CpaC